MSQRKEERMAHKSWIFFINMLSSSPFTRAYFVNKAGQDSKASYSQVETTVEKWRRFALSCKLFAPSGSSLSDITGQDLNPSPVPHVDLVKAPKAVRVCRSAGPQIDGNFASFALSGKCGARERPFCACVQHPAQHTNERPVVLMSVLPLAAPCTALILAKQVRLITYHLSFSSSFGGKNYFHQKLTPNTHPPSIISVHFFESRQFKRWCLWLGHSCPPRVICCSSEWRIYG